jgi:hypothetical protein
MSKNNKILLTIGLTIFGWFMTGFGFTTKLGHPISSICFYTGLILVIFGIIFFIITIKGK